MNKCLITPGSSERVGQAPGQLVAPEGSPASRIDITVYNGQNLERVESVTTDDIAKYMQQDDAVVWIDVNGLGDADVLASLGEVLQLHRLILEDLTHLSQRPKVEAYGEGLFIINQFPLFCEQDFEQISVFVRGHVVLTVQAYQENRLEPILKRIQENRGRIRKAPAAYLVYAVLDLTVDAFFPALEEMDARVEVYEDEIIAGGSIKSAEVLHHIYEVKKQVVKIRRVMWATREMLNIVVRDHGAVFQLDTQVYLRDAQDHAVRLLEIAEMQRELCNGLVELHQNVLNQRMNEVMKTLTITATVFIPLTFIAGIYGMNFDTEASGWNMPELGMKYAYPAVWLVMIVSAVTMLYFFKRRGWIGKGGESK